MEELRFFSLEKLPEEISPPIRPVMRRYVEQRRKFAGGSEEAVIETALS